MKAAYHHGPLRKIKIPGSETLRARCIACPRRQVAGCRCRAAAPCSGLVGPRAASVALTRPLSPVGTEPQMYCQVSSLPWADVGRHDRHSVTTVKMQAEFEQVCGGVVYDSLVQGGEVKIAYATKIRAQRRSSINLDCITKQWS